MSEFICSFQLRNLKFSYRATSSRQFEDSGGPSSEYEKFTRVVFGDADFQFGDGAPIYAEDYNRCKIEMATRDYMVDGWKNDTRRSARFHLGAMASFSRSLSLGIYLPQAHFNWMFPNIDCLVSPTIETLEVTFREADEPEDFEVVRYQFGDWNGI